VYGCFHQRRRGGRIAQPRVRVDCRDAEAGSSDLPERVIFLQEKLTAVVDGDAVRYVGRESFVESIDNELHRVLPRSTDELTGSVADQRMCRAARMTVREVLID
jgi:hypothetical protein